MYESYFGLTERPFSIAPDPQYLYMSSRHKEAMAHLSYGLSQGGCFIVLTGEVGTGKTTLCRTLLTDLPKNVDVALILNPNLGSTELLQTVCDELKVRYRQKSTQKQLLDRINKHLLKTYAANRHTVLIIDEAQLLKRNVLEKIRLLTNLETTKSKLLQIILIGQPELYDMLSRNDLRQLAQRVTARYHLDSLERKDIEEYVNYRLNVAGCKQPIFSRQALNKLHTLTSGIPRKINVLADHALLSTYSQSKTLVDAKTVAKSAKEVFIVTQKRDPKENSFILMKPSKPRKKSESSRSKPSRSKSSRSKTSRSKTSRSKSSRSKTKSSRTVVANKPSILSGLSLPSFASLSFDDLRWPSPFPWHILVSIFMFLGLGMIVWWMFGYFLSSEPEVTTTQAVETQIVETQVKVDNVEDSYQSVAGDAVPRSGGVVVSDTYLTVEDDPIDLQAVNLFEQFDENSSLGKKLEASGDVTGRISALRNLALEWQFELPEKLLKPICKIVAEQGMKCLEVKDWSKVSVFNRPAIILLKHNEQVHRVVVKTLEGDQVALAIGSSIKIVSVDEIKQRWAGSGLIYWRPSLNNTPVLKQGDQNELVKDIRVQLNEVLSSIKVAPLKELKNPKFDEDMSEKVKLLQKSFALVEDGLIGSETYIIMNEFVKPKSTPVLRQRVASVVN